jgi:hypothetical protein
VRDDRSLYGEDDQLEGTLTVRRRDRVLRRSPVARWARRILGALGTAVVLAVGVMVAGMVLPGGDDRAVSQAPAATPSAGADAKAAKQRRRAARRRAIARVRRAGYAPVRVADYRARQVLRVLIGKPVGGTPPGLRAFFFVRGEYVGRDAGAPSGTLRPGRQRRREITLVYTLYEPDDRACCPEGGDVRVHFRWNGEALEPREPIPPAARRLPAAP